MGMLIHHNHSGYQLPDDHSLTRFAAYILKQEQLDSGNINFIFTSNQEILELNRKYLGHDYYTDVIAFHYGPVPHAEGDIFISLDRVWENAGEYQVSFWDELLRVFIHGLLHLIGYTDKTSGEREQMRALEDRYLQTYHLEFR